MSEKSELPSCRDFLVAAVRDLRPKRKIVQGVRLHLIYNIAREFYSDEEIRRTLNAGLKDTTLLIMAQFITWKDGKAEDWSRSRALARILRHHPLESSYWRFSKAGTQVHTREGSYRTVGQIFLYVREDGLPVNVQKILSNAPVIPAPTQGQRILAAMTKES